MASKSQRVIPPGPPAVCSFAELGKQFLRLGAVGFGGPAANVALLHQELVAKRHWIPEDQFLRGFTLAQVFPGPLSTQVAIYIGYRLQRVRGAFFTGCCFILLAFVLMISLTWAYFRFGMTPALQWIFSGMTPVVLAMIALSG